MYLEDIAVLKQKATSVSTNMDDTALADFTDDMVDAGRKPEQFLRIWLHTHPGSSVDPSHTDEITFREAFGDCDWAIMGILGRTGNVYARIRFKAGPGLSLDLPVKTFWGSIAPEELDFDNWKRIYDERVDTGKSYGHYGYCGYDLGYDSHWADERYQHYRPIAPKLNDQDRPPIRVEKPAEKKEVWEKSLSELTDQEFAEYEARAANWVGESRYKGTRTIEPEDRYSAEAELRDDLRVSEIEQRLEELQEELEDLDMLEDAVEIYELQREMGDLRQEHDAIFEDWKNQPGETASAATGFLDS